MAHRETIPYHYSRRIGSSRNYEGKGKTAMALPVNRGLSNQEHAPLETSSTIQYMTEDSSSIQQQGMNYEKRMKTEDGEELSVRATRKSPKRARSTRASDTHSKDGKNSPTSSSGASPVRRSKRARQKPETVLDSSIIDNEEMEELKVALELSKKQKVCYHHRH